MEHDNSTTNNQENMNLDKTGQVPRPQFTKEKSVVESYQGELGGDLLEVVHGGADVVIAHEQGVVLLQEPHESRGNRQVRGAWEGKIRVDRSLGTQLRSGQISEAYCCR